MDEEDRSFYKSLAALGLVALLTALGVWMFTAYQKNQELQHCYLEQRKDCEPLDTTSSH